MEFEQRSWQENEGAYFCYKSKELMSVETQPLLKVTIPNLVDEKLL